MDLFSYLLYRLDLRRRPLSKVVPELAELLDQPAKVLRRGPIVIGSASFLGMGLLLGFFMALLVGLCLFPLSWVLIAKLPRQDQEPFVGVALAGIYLVGVIIAVKLLRRRKVVLTAEGIEFHRGWLRVHCPWALFRVFSEAAKVEESLKVGGLEPGNIFSIGASLPKNAEAGKIVMPLRTEVIPSVVAFKKNKVVAQGQAVQTEDFTINAQKKLVLADSYRVSGVELCGLLVQLAWALGKDEGTNGKQ